MILSLSIALFAPRRSRLWRGGLVLFALVFASMAIIDQHRLQPWAYEFFLIAVVLAMTPTRRSLVLIRLLVVSIYFHSALSKLDSSFLETNGQQLVSGLLSSVDLTMDWWSPGARRLAAASLPVGELLVAIGLIVPAMRRFALPGAVLMHLLLLVTLGPWGLKHEAGVLIWNVFFIAQDILLFGTFFKTDLVKDAATATDMQADKSTRLVGGLVVAVIVLPLLEPFGWFDHWPAWAVYASRPERVTVFIDRTARSRLPESLQKHVEPPRPLDDWCEVRLDRWSLEALAVPLYPQDRFQIGVAIDLAHRYELDSDIRVFIESSASRWTGKRSSRELIGREDIEREADRFRLNATPR